MTVSINWLTSVITVEQTDLVPLGGNRYQLDIETFRQTLKGIEDDEEGMPFSDTHRRNAPVTLAGVTFAQTFEILPPYTVEFEDGVYQIEIVGGNNNLLDVKVLNSVSLVIGNSAGLITVTSGSGLSIDQASQLIDVWKRLGLDPANPMTTTDTEITAGDIDIQMTEPVAGTVVSTRQP